MVNFKKNIPHGTVLGHFTSSRCQSGYFVQRNLCFMWSTLIKSCSIKCDLFPSNGASFRKSLQSCKAHADEKDRIPCIKRRKMNAGSRNYWIINCQDINKLPSFATLWSSTYTQFHAKYHAYHKQLSTLEDYLEDYFRNVRFPTYSCR